MLIFKLLKNECPEFRNPLEIRWAFAFGFTDF